MISLSHYLVFGAILFFIGVAGVLTRRNAIIILMSIELMMNAVNITLISFGHYLHNVTGQIFAIFVVAVAAGEAAVGLAIIIELFRGRQTLNVDEINIMKW
jgi:NADH-quinone oxidoreductase subunit K